MGIDNAVVFLCYACSIVLFTDVLCSCRYSAADLIPDRKTIDFRFSRLSVMCNDNAFHVLDSWQQLVLGLAHTVPKLFQIRDKLEFAMRVRNAKNLGAINNARIKDVYISLQWAS